MQQLTVRTLIESLVKACKKDKSILDKKIIIADDNEGNGYHGMFYTLTTKETAVKECIDASNGISDSEETDPANLIILG